MGVKIFRRYIKNAVKSNHAILRLASVRILDKGSIELKSRFSLESTMFAISLIRSFEKVKI